MGMPTGAAGTERGREYSPEVAHRRCLGREEGCTAAVGRPSLAHQGQAGG